MRLNKIKNKSKEEQFKAMFYYWAGRFKLPEISRVSRDNRSDAPCFVEWTHNNTIKVGYNTKILKDRPVFVILSDVLHEIGHIIQNLPVGTRAHLVESEYQAERFALKTICYYYPRLYNQLRKYYIKTNRLEELRWSDPMYYEAFSRLLFYRRIEKEK